MNIFFCNRQCSIRRFPSVKMGRFLGIGLGLGGLFLSPVAIAEMDGSLAGEGCVQNPEAFRFISAPEDAATMTAPYPEISWQLPEHQAKNLEVKVQDELGQELYYWNFQLAPLTQENTEGNVMSLQVPSQLAVKALTPGSRQVWELTLICDGANFEQNISIRQQIEGHSPL